ncbi:hypothetical protein M426DRAFT_318024 [Hypoxylon sp. CI-4A]|nr:hypothetical protein M426DRAFT_318024 [Hypoxylon sp. CI-4A]
MSHITGSEPSTSLMGFSVQQPALGQPLQFFPAMGSNELDEMINAYVAGDAPIADKRASVSMEFFEHVVVTGELFKFFMVYPSLGSTTGSPVGSMLDSGYASNFTSPVMSENQWSQFGRVSYPATESKAKPLSSKKSAMSADFSHLPGMKILTRDGKDVTSSASRGCKTKEQRDHAHLMRIIKACDSCRRKKVRCDPSHKRSTGSSTARTSKKAKKATASVSASSALPQPSIDPQEQYFYDQSSSLANEVSPSSFDSSLSELLDPNMDWTQFVQFDEEPMETIPIDYDFFHDPASLLSPTSSSSFSPSQPITPAQSFNIDNTTAGTAEAAAQVPLPPYLNPGGDAGNNYTDFNLYSPSSSICLDDDPSLTKEVAALPHTNYLEYSNHQRPVDGYSRETIGGQVQNLDAEPSSPANEGHLVSSRHEERVSTFADLDNTSFHDSLSSRPMHSFEGASNDHGLIEQVPEWQVPGSPSRPSPLPRMRTDELHQRPLAISPAAVVDALPTRWNVSPLWSDLDMSSSRRQDLQLVLSSRLDIHGRPRPSSADQQTRQSLITALTSGIGARGTASVDLGLPKAMITDKPTTDPSPHDYNSLALTKAVANKTPSRSPISQTHEPVEVSLSLSSSSLSTQLTRNMVETTERSTSKKTSTPDSDSLKVQDLARQSSSVSAAGLASQYATGSGVLDKDSSPQGSAALSTFRSKANEDVLSLERTASKIIAALSLLALFMSELIMAEDAILLSVLTVSVGCIALYRPGTTCVDMLGKTKRRLSYFRRFFPASTKGISCLENNTKHHKNSGTSSCSKVSGLSRSQRDFEQDISLQSYNGFPTTHGLRRIAHLAW